MNKWYGKVGYVESVEVEPGVCEVQETVRQYYGEFVRKSSKFQIANEVIDDKDVAVKLSIVADPYAENHFRSMRYAEIWGEKWKITSVEINRPRLILQIGGLWNG